MNRALDDLRRDKRRASWRRYNLTPPGAMRSQRYDATPNGQARKRRYEETIRPALREANPNTGCQIEINGRARWRSTLSRDDLIARTLELRA